MTRVTACLLLGFWAVATLKNAEASKGCGTAEYGSVGDGVDGSLSPKLSTSTMKPVVAIDTNLDQPPFQGLIEVDKHPIPVVRQNRLGFHGLYPYS